MRKERNVCYEDEGFRRDRVTFELCRIESFLHRLDIDSVLVRELVECLLTPDVFVPKTLSHERSSCLTYELFSAIKTTVSLLTSEFSILLYLFGMAPDTLFLYVITNVLLIMAPVWHESKFLALHISH